MLIQCLCKGDFIDNSISHLSIKNQNLFIWNSGRATEEPKKVEIIILIIAIIQSKMGNFGCNIRVDIECSIINVHVLIYSINRDTVPVWASLIKLFFLLLEFKKIFWTYLGVKPKILFLILKVFKEKL